METATTIQKKYAEIVRLEIKDLEKGGKYKMRGISLEKTTPIEMIDFIKRIFSEKKITLETNCIDKAKAIRIVAYSSFANKRTGHKTTTIYHQTIDEIFDFITENVTKNPDLI